MKITSKFTTNIVSKIITKILKQKLGYNAELKLNAIRINLDDEQTHIHLDVDADISKEELLKIISTNMGLQDEETVKGLFFFSLRRICNLFNEEKMLAQLVEQRIKNSVGQGFESLTFSFWFYFTQFRKEKKLCKN